MQSYRLAISGTGSDSCFHIPTTHTTIPTNIPIPDPKPSFLFPKSVSSFRNRSGPLRLKAKAAINDGWVAEHKELTFYELLGIPESGSATEIKQAYKQLARKYHPDVSPPDLVEEYTEKFIRVQEAYETLSDSRRRALYDQDMARGLHLAFSARRYQSDEGVEDVGSWRNRWQSQLSELKRRSMNKDAATREEHMSWGARMRRQREGSSDQL
ncbi:chaperone protein dnaJ 20, chloroplastic-like [Pyrus communis]|uniref:chaperone protein dnaJ 20, chloroplastic-like n=1 Tax=Pyrus communis TaxID=23211 RepID=UPI0035C0F707